MGALAIYATVISTLSLVASLYAIIRIEVQIRSEPHEVSVPSHELYTGTKELYREPEAEEERRITPEEIFQGDLDFQEIP